MIAEAKEVIDAAREQGLVLRLLGGLAVRFHCRSLDFCERDHGDIDLVGHRADAERITLLLQKRGYEEIAHVREATLGRQLQFARECRHKDQWAPYGRHQDDHVDVFLDTFKMEHVVDLGERLTLDDYTVTVSDLVITKLQIAGLTDKDERDVLTLFKDVALGSVDEPGTIDAPYIAGLCAHDWGLYHEVELNLAHLRERLRTYTLDPGERRSVEQKLARLQEAIVAQPKSRAWKLRAKLGTRVPWHETVEEQDSEATGPSDAPSHGGS
jgi:hypothetical protein